MNRFTLQQRCGLFKIKVQEKLYHDVDFAENLMKLIFILVDTLRSKTAVLGYQDSQAWSYRSQYTHYEWLFGETCWAEASVVHICLKMSVLQPIRSMEISNAPW